MCRALQLCCRVAVAALEGRAVGPFRVVKLSCVRAHLRAVLDLKKVHAERLNVHFGDREHEQDQEIDILTRKITQLFNSAGAKLQRVLSKDKKDKKDPDSNVKRNIQRCVRPLTAPLVPGCRAPCSRLPCCAVRSLASKLQELSSEFRVVQKEYLSQLKQFKEGGSWGALVGEETSSESKRDVDLVGAVCPRRRFHTAVRPCLRFVAVSSARCSRFPPAGTVVMNSPAIVVSARVQGFNTAQSMELMSAEELAQERDAEIRAIVTSIHELATVFKELAAMVIDQGTIIDRIDYNMEQVRCGLAHRPRRCLARWWLSVRVSRPLSVQPRVWSSFTR